MIPVVWHISNGFWDCAFPRFILDGATECIHFSGLSWVDGLADREIGIIVIPGRHSCEHYAELNRAGAMFDKLIWIIIGDEEGIFHADQLSHPNSKLWWFMPPFAPKQKVDRVCINGWPTEAPEMISGAILEDLPAATARPFDWSFYGQVTHSRRVACLNGLQGIPNGNLLATEGFTQGVARNEYYKVMVQSKFVLCPSGPCTPDSFRIAEALEAGCIPLADDLTQHSFYPPGYWAYVFGQPNRTLPFPVIWNWDSLSNVIGSWLDGWEKRATFCNMWWTSQKLKWIDQMRRDIYDSK